MHQEKYSLKWHTYSDHLKTMMKDLMMNEDFSDVTLVTEDKKQIKANINILSSCSPVFKDTLKRERHSSPIMYLRGIQYSEMESIMQFIYLGEATVCEERLDELLAVAKSLEIKQLYNSGSETYEPDDEPLPDDPGTSGEQMKKENITTCNIPELPEQSTQERSSKAIGIIGSKYECEQCDKIYTTRLGLDLHKKSFHEGLKYTCDECDYQASQQSNLKVHIRNKHEGVRYACDHCDYQATDKRNLTRHIQTVHEGIMKACDLCDYKAKDKRTIINHIKSMHSK